VKLLCPFANSQDSSLGEVAGHSVFGEVAEHKLYPVQIAMLAADKLQLQSTLRQQATALKEKEFNLHHGNLMTVGTQAAVLAGLDVTMFIEVNAEC
jgi:hypothetical protein